MLDALGCWGLGCWEEICSPHLLLKRIARPKGYGLALLPPTEPPHWGADETEGLLERVAGENASLRCPARGEVEPRVELGSKRWPGFQEFDYSVTSLGYGGYGITMTTL